MNSSSYDHCVYFAFEGGHLMATAAKNTQHTIHKSSTITQENAGSITANSYHYCNISPGLCTWHIT